MNLLHLTEQLKACIANNHLEIAGEIANAMEQWLLDTPADKDSLHWLFDIKNLKRYLERKLEKGDFYECKDEMRNLLQGIDYSCRHYVRTYEAKITALQDKIEMLKKELTGKVKKKRKYTITAQERERRSARLSRLQNGGSTT